MLVNVNPAALAAQIASAAKPILRLFAPPLDPAAMILSRGWNVGAQANLGATAQVGYLWPTNP